MIPQFIKSLQATCDRAKRVQPQITYLNINNIFILLIAIYHKYQAVYDIKYYLFWKIRYINFYNAFGYSVIETNNVVYSILLLTTDK